ncbi:MAG: SpoIIE family protein phosphatase [Candidatus Omnitrophica bacterium]|nr:SpoIIE family protein phosphatase [Candidatus Omnitrophota bacterium]
MTKIIEKLRSYQAKITIILVLAMLFSAALSNFLIYEFARKAQFSQLQEKLKIIAQTASLLVDADMLLEVPLNQQGIKTSEYKIIAEKLRKIKKTNPYLKYIYTLAKTEKTGILKFIVDPDTEDMTKKTAATSFPGDTYDASAFPEMLEAFNKACVDKELTHDPWGTFLSAYAPIYDKNGKSIAILGIDMTAHDVEAIQKKVTQRAILVLVLGVILSLSVAAFISKGVTNPITELAQGTRHIAEGNLDYRVKVKSRDEIGTLARSFNSMAQDLKDHIEELKRTTAAKERIESELKIANTIQTSLLPRIFPPFPERKEFDIYAMMEPAKEVGGDLFDFFLVDKNKLCFLIGDVSGKGIPAALFMAISKALFKTEGLRGLKPDEILTRVNQIIFPDNDTCMFVTVFCATLDISTGRLEYANAGHNPPMLYSGKAEFEFLDVAKGFVVGAMPDTKFTLQTIDLKPQDAILLYTDGVTEAMNPEDKMFSEKKLKSCVSALKDKNIEELIKGIRDEVSIFAQGTIQSDDITMLALRYNGVAYA